MSAQPITTFTTNDKACSVHEVVLGCDKLWAMGQEEAIRRLSKKRSSASSKYELISDFGARAARIAAAYAGFYLEQGEDGNRNSRAVSTGWAWRRLPANRSNAAWTSSPMIRI